MDLFEEVLAAGERELGRAWRYRGVNMDYWTYRAAFEAVGRYGGPMAGRRALDVGVGRCYLAMIFSLAGMQCHGVEIADPPPAFASAVAGRGIDVRWRFDVERTPLPYDEETFDVATSTGVLEHLHHSPGPILREMHRVLRYDGIAVIVVPNIATLRNRLRLLFGRSPLADIRFLYASGRNFIGHVHEYTRHELASVLRWSGFEVLESRTFPSGTYVQRASAPISASEPDSVWVSVKNVDDYVVGIRGPKQRLYHLLTKLVPDSADGLLVVAQKTRRARPEMPTGFAGVVGDAEWFAVGARQAPYAGARQAE